MCAKDFVNSVMIVSFVLFASYQRVSAQTSATTIGPITQLEVSTGQTTTLVFPAAIKSVDRGAGSVICKMVKGIENVLKVKAVDSIMKPTNLTVYTADGRIYPFAVRYDQTHPTSMIQFNGPGGLATSTLFAGVQHTDTELQDLADSLLTTVSTRHRPRAKANNGMHMAVTGAFLSKDMLFLQFKIANSSRVRYDIDFVRYYVRDKHEQKRTIHIEKEVTPLFVAYSQPQGIAQDHSLKMVVAFDKFTIADKKLFIAEVYELKGDRTLVCKIKGRQLLKVTPL
ncbi:conjugative transposon protein TraN [Chitinophaga parva]|uniref:Conjugative transposon protein TraN n=1 Tax=Chitinophaga parva TaxID=2169414 RepID=A0A2T7BLN1_9BACT|nr:conjugative transposon protein TraN [Chitinophaga parva]PUZ28582.1 conjugative transposon protein TraN [Chitinophaga parva]